MLGRWIAHIILLDYKGTHGVLSYGFLLGETGFYKWLYIRSFKLTSAFGVMAQMWLAFSKLLQMVWEQLNNAMCY
jgi:hypothetical protein